MPSNPEDSNYNIFKVFGGESFAYGCPTSKPFEPLDPYAPIYPQIIPTETKWYDPDIFFCDYCRHAFFKTSYGIKEYNDHIDKCRKGKK